MDATVFVDDCTRKRNYPADEMHRNFLASTNLPPPTEGTPQVLDTRATGRDADNDSVHFCIEDHKSFIHLKLHPNVRHAAHASSAF